MDGLGLDLKAQADTACYCVLDVAQRGQTVSLIQKHVNEEWDAWSGMRTVAMAFPNTGST